MGDLNSNEGGADSRL